MRGVPAKETAMSLTHDRSAPRASHPRTAARSMFDPALVRPAIADSFRKLTPRTQFRNPVMFCVYVGSILTTILWIAALQGRSGRRFHRRDRAVAVVHRAVRELRRSARGRAFEGAGRLAAQCETQRGREKLSAPRAKAVVEVMASTDLRKGDVVLSKPATRSRPTAT